MRLCFQNGRVFGIGGFGVERLEDGVWTLRNPADLL